MKYFLQLFSSLSLIQEVSYLGKNVLEALVNRLVKLAQEKSVVK